MTSQIDELIYGTFASWLPLISVKTFEVRLQPDGPISISSIGINEFQSTRKNFSINLQRCDRDSP